MPNRYQFIADVTIPDDAPVTANSAFTKTWRVQNTGDAPWNGFTLRHVNGERMSVVATVAVPSTPVGGTVDISLPLTAPARLGTQFTDWLLHDAAGVPFGAPLYARIVVTPAPAQTVPPVLNARVLADVTVPDDTVMTPAQAFTKTWRVQNNGTVAWGAGATLRFIGGRALTVTTTVPAPNLQPGQTADLSVALTAPPQPGTHYGDWRLFDGRGNPFGEVMWVRIVVPVQSLTPSTNAPTPGITPLNPSTPRPVVPVIPPAPAPVPSRPQPTVTAPVPFYSQRDPRWSSKQLGNNRTLNIGLWGCLLTSMTMVASARGKGVNPAQFHDLMTQRNGFFNGYLTRWEALQNVYADIPFERKLDGPSAALIQAIDAAVAAGRPVIALVDITPATAYSDNDQHWVVVSGKANNDYWIHDPYRLEPGYTSLMERYGRAGGTLQAAVRAAIFYK